MCIAGHFSPGPCFTATRTSDGREGKGVGRDSGVAASGEREGVGQGKAMADFDRF